MSPQKSYDISYFLAHAFSNNNTWSVLIGNIFPVVCQVLLQILSGDSNKSE